VFALAAELIVLSGTMRIANAIVSRFLAHQIRRPVLSSLSPATDYPSLIICPLSVRTEHWQDKGHSTFASPLLAFSQQTSLPSIPLVSASAFTDSNKMASCEGAELCTPNVSTNEQEIYSETDNEDKKSVVSFGEREVRDGSSRSVDCKVSTPGGESVADSVDDLASAVGRIHLAEVSPPAEVIHDDDKISQLPETVKKAAFWIEQSERILVLSGAGVSVAAGLPDFRSPGTGLYDNLQKYNLPYPEAVFELDFYRRNPKPFLLLAKELWPSSGSGYLPTLTHSFLALLAKKNRLLRNYTQNIDGLEFLASIPDHLLVECHGHFRSASCIRCGTAADAREVENVILTSNDIPRCQQKRCNGLVKPDIVFFGENLPDRFHSLWRGDTKSADLCLILGTSLQVAPVSMLPDMVNCRRILFNRELVGDFGDREGDDLFHGGDCDETIGLLAQALGWEGELKGLQNEARKETETNSSKFSIRRLKRRPKNSFQESQPT
jgi:NAD-dependent SIR2 family protein deacetylase